MIGKNDPQRTHGRFVLKVVSLVSLPSVNRPSSFLSFRFCPVCVIAIVWPGQGYDDGSGSQW
jgi:hypothetical protein